MSAGEFSVYQYFQDDSYEKAASAIDLESAVKLARRLAASVGGRIGTTRRIIITDSGDCTVFEWLFDEGVTFPEECAD